MDITGVSGLLLKNKISIASKFPMAQKNGCKACQQEPKFGLIKVLHYKF